MFALSFICFVVAWNFKLHQEISWSSIYHGYITNGIRFYLYAELSKITLLVISIYIKVSDSGVNASMGLALVIVFILGYFY